MYEMKYIINIDSSVSKRYAMCRNLNIKTLNVIVWMKSFLIKQKPDLRETKLYLKRTIEFTFEIRPEVR